MRLEIGNSVRSPGRPVALRLLLNRGACFELAELTGGISPQSIWPQGPDKLLSGQMEPRAGICTFCAIQEQSGNSKSPSSEYFALWFRSTRQFQEQLNWDSGGGMADEEPRTQLRLPSLRSGTPSYLHQSTPRPIAMKPRPSSRRPHRRRPTP